MFDKTNFRVNVLRKIVLKDLSRLKYLRRNCMIKWKK